MVAASLCPFHRQQTWQPRKAGCKKKGHFGLYLIGSAPAPLGGCQRVFFFGLRGCFSSSGINLLYYLVIPNDLSTIPLATLKIPPSRLYLQLRLYFGLLSSNLCTYCINIVVRAGFSYDCANPIAISADVTTTIGNNTFAATFTPG